MSAEEPTREGRIRRVINEEVQLAQTGNVTKVYEHTQSDDQWNFHVDVRIDDDTHPRKVPVAVPAPLMIAPPRSVDHEDGPDQVLVQYLDDAEDPRPIVTHILYNNKDRPPLGSEGIVRLRRGDLYLELHDKGNWARLSKKSADDATPDLVIEMDDTGTIKLGDPNGSLEPIARVGDSVEVSDPDSGTITGEITSGSSDVEST